MSHSSATCGSLTLFLSCLLTSEFIWIVCAVQKLHMQSSRLLKGIFWQKNNCVEARNTLAQMHMLRKELWHGFVVHKHNHDCRLAQGMSWTHAPPLSHTHMISPQIPCPLQSEHMSFVCRPSSPLTERHLETLISWSHPCSAPCYSQTGVPAQMHTHRDPQTHT